MREKTNHTPSPNRLGETGLSVLLLYIFSLWGFVVAQPIYTDMFQDGGYFRVHQLPVSDIWLALLILSFAIPGAWILALWSLNRFFPVLARTTCQVLIALLLCGFCLLVLRIFPNASTLLKLGISAFCGFQLTRLILRNRESSFLLYFMVPGAIMFPIWFLLSCPLTTPFQFEASGAWPSSAAHRVSPTPVVMIVFDELPLTSLLDDNGQIDAVNYPNFAALAQKATWFPNAATVHSATRGAIPAILTGKYPPVEFDWGSLLSGHPEFKCKSPLPTTEAFPHTVFSLLEKSHDMQVFESRIYLCNSAGCQSRIAFQPLRKRFLSLMRRCSEEYLFKILFNNNELNKFYFGFKAISQKNQKQMEDVNRPESSLVSHEYDLALFRKFLATIQARKPQEKRPPFYFIHPILPHSPWEFYPSGRNYPASRMVNLSADVLCENSPSLLYCQNTEQPRSQYQRHLLQAGYADSLLGEAISRLKAAHLYDQSLIIVTADHGISFMPSEHRRPISAHNFGDIMSVPLLIRQPGQTVGKRDYRQAETVDIVPTVAHSLNIAMNWQADGESLLQQPAIQRASHAVCSPQTRLKFSASQLQAAKQAALHRKRANFGELRLRPEEIFNTGQHRQLIGVRLSNSQVAGNSRMRFTLSPAQPFNASHRQDTRPVLLTGRLFLPVRFNQPRLLAETDLAVAVKGSIVAVSQPFHYNRTLQQADLAILIPEHSYNPKTDNLQLLEVTGPPLRFYRLPIQPHPAGAKTENKSL